MTCPACQAELGTGTERCPACGTLVAPQVQGALAPELSRETPPARGKAPIREIPGLRKRDKNEKTWKDEVRERVQKRKRKPRTESEAELPLFREVAFEGLAKAPPSEPLVAQKEPSLPAAAAPGPASEAAPLLEAEPAAEFAFRAPAPTRTLSEDLPPPAPELPFEQPLDEEPDLPLGPLAGTLDIPESIAHDPLGEARQRAEEARFDEPSPDVWRLDDDAPPPVELRPVERPAQFAERFEAAAVDAGVLCGLSTVVVYFASRAAHVPVTALVAVWPWLSAYLALLGLAYAAYFTGTTGQTPGKMLFGLRVVEASGGPPSYPRALARAAIGALGSLLAGAGVLPLFFDPARRALHDRLFRTRVVKG